MTNSFQIQIIQEEYSIDNLFETSIVVNVLIDEGNYQNKMSILKKKKSEIGSRINMDLSVSKTYDHIVQLVTAHEPNSGIVDSTHLNFIQLQVSHCKLLNI